jgi:hypothetical protein
MTSKISMSLDECVKNSAGIISRRGLCILAYDVIGSEDICKVLGCKKFSRKFYSMNSDLNNQFKKYLVNSQFDSVGLRNRFEIYRGDMASACVNSSDGVRQIIFYQSQTYPDLPLRWVVAENYWDKVLRQI